MVLFGLEHLHIWDFVLPEWWHHLLSPSVTNGPLIMTILAIWAIFVTISASRQSLITIKVVLLGLEYTHIWDFFCQRGGTM